VLEPVGKPTNKNGRNYTDNLGAKTVRIGDGTQTSDQDFHDSIPNYATLQARIALLYNQKEALELITNK
jgi:hypothetical protein